MLRKSVCVFIFLVLILSLFISGCSTTTSQVTKNFDNKEKTIVTKVIDGDSIITQGGEHVRLLGIDTPEKGEPYYSDATNFLKERILMKEVYLERDLDDKDQYDRLLRYVWLDDSLVNLELVQQGFAIARFYDNMKYMNEIQEAEKQAIQNKIGIWSQLDNPSNTKTSINDTQTTQHTNLTLTDVDSSCISLGCPQGTQYVASKNSDKYHKCYCSFAKRISPQNLICFSSKEEAEQDRQACSSCKP
jgi:micrococcal nuclease